MAQEPLHKLEDVFRIINSGNSDKIWFPILDKSVGAVVAYFDLVLSQDLDPTEARSFILRGMLTLTAEAFCERQMIWNDKDCICDIYGIMFHSAPWYVKFYIDYDDDYLAEVSFHPPEREMATVTGTKIPQGEIIYENEMWKMRV